MTVWHGRKSVLWKTFFSFHQNPFRSHKIEFIFLPFRATPNVELFSLKNAFPPSMIFPQNIGCTNVPLGMLEVLIFSGILRERLGMRGTSVRSSTMFHLSLHSISALRYLFCGWDMGSRRDFYDDDWSSFIIYLVFLMIF